MCQAQLECSYQSNLALNFTTPDVQEEEEEESEYGSAQSFMMTMMSMSASTSPSPPQTPKSKQHHLGDSNQHHDQPLRRRSGGIRDFERPFSHCLLPDLKAYLLKEKGLQNTYVIKFDLNRHRQICKISQIAIDVDGRSFSRDVQRTVNGRDSAWPQ